MAISKKVVVGLLLPFLIGCDPLYLPLQPDVPQGHLSEIKRGEPLYDWSANVSQEGISLHIKGTVYLYVGKGNAYLVFPMTITNTRTHPIRLIRDNLAVSIDGSPAIRDSIELERVILAEGKVRNVLTPTRLVREIDIDAHSTAFVDIRLRDERVRTVWFPQDSVILYLAAFHDIETGETIPFTIRFQKVK